MKKIIITTNELMEIYGIQARSTITAWTSDGMPKESRGKFDLVEVVRWKNEKQEAEDDTAKDAKERYWAAKADNEEIKRDVQLGNLLSRDELEPEWCARVGEVCQGLDSLRMTLPPLLEGKPKCDMGAVIAKQTDAIRNSYARNGKFTPAIKKGK